MKLFAVLNITPDSFSDGGQYDSYSKAISRGKVLMTEGADVLDIGGDSSRPGSLCVGEEVEWQRIGEVVNNLAPLFPVSVDTHHSSVAEKSIKAGTKYINDISAGNDPEMFKLIASSKVKYILTHTRCSIPHFFDREIEGDVVSHIKKFFVDKIELAKIAGIRDEQIILDPGMGAFLSSKASISWELLDRIGELDELRFPLMLGISRKGFLKQEDEKNITERDRRSSAIAEKISKEGNSRRLNYLRVHDVKMHKNKN